MRNRSSNSSSGAFLFLATAAVLATEDAFALTTNDGRLSTPDSSGTNSRLDSSRTIEGDFDLSDLSVPIDADYRNEARLLVQNPDTSDCQSDARDGDHASWNLLVCDDPNSIRQRLTPILGGTDAARFANEAHTTGFTAVGTNLTREVAEACHEHLLHQGIRSVILPTNPGYNRE